MDCSNNITLAVFYPGHSEFIATQLCYFAIAVGWLLGILLPVELIIYIISTILNLFHILVLLQTPMRTSSLGPILIFITVSTTASFMHSIKTMIDLRFDLKTFPPPLGYVQMELALTTIQTFSRRFATWLAFGMSVTQILASRNDKVLKYSSVVFGIKVILVVLIPNILLSVFGFYGTEIVSTNNPLAFLTNTSDKMYSIQVSQLFSRNEHMISSIYDRMEDVSAYWLPSPLIVIVILWLRGKFYETENRRKRDSIATMETVTENNTKLVFNLTRTYFLADFEIAICKFISKLFATSIGTLSAHLL